MAKIDSGGLQLTGEGEFLTEMMEALLERGLQHRKAGGLHQQALRALGNRLVGILDGGLHHHTKYDEHTAWHTAT